MNYSVMMTNNAMEQTQEIVAYIAETLMVPEIAQQWKERLKAEIKKLSFMPGRIPLTEEEPWRSKGVINLLYRIFWCISGLMKMRKRCG